MDSLPAYVRDYRLETEFHKRRIVHIYDDPDAPPGSQRRRETWKSGRKPIGSGGQGRVFLHTCTSGNRLATHRAVKMIPLQLGSGRQRYGQELATMIKFSHSKVGEPVDLIHFTMALRPGGSNSPTLASASVLATTPMQRVR